MKKVLLIVSSLVMLLVVWGKVKYHLMILAQPVIFPAVTQIDESYQPWIVAGIKKNYPTVKYTDFLFKQAAQPLRAGVVPHHLMASNLIADFFSRVAAQPMQFQPTTVIIISPNHFHLGSTPIITGDNFWQTQFGLVSSNEQLINQIKKNSQVSQDNQIIGHEHGIAGLIPFVKYYLPESKVVPIILMPDLSLLEVENFANQLAALTDDKTLILASVDFSHNLNYLQAKEKDNQTWPLLINYQFSQLAELGDQNLDSPKSISLLLMVCRKKNLTNIIFFNHNHSGLMIRNFLVGGTSYFELGVTNRLVSHF